MAAATRRPVIPRLDTETGAVRSRFGARLSLDQMPVAVSGASRRRIGRLSAGRKPLGPLPGSLLLHAALLAILLISFERRRPQLALPLNGVSVVFEGGLQHSDAVNAAPTRHSVSQPSSAKGLPPPPAPAPPIPMPPVPAPPTPAPPEAQPEVNLGEVQPPPSEAPEAASPQFIIPPPQPRPTPRAVHRPPKQHFLVMNGMSFNGPPAPPVLNPGHQGLDLIPSNRNATQRSAIVLLKGHIGAGYLNTLSKWVSEHTTYPAEAARLGQQGKVVVDVTIDRSGRVISERLFRANKSPFLTMGWLGVWRDAHVPKFPKNTTDHKITIRYTLHYVLTP